MKKINFFSFAAIVCAAVFAFCSCSKDDSTPSGGNEDLFQSEVDKTVKAGKTSDNVILLVAFGSTWQQSFDTFDKLIDEYKKEFNKGDEKWDVYLAFSSAICSNQANAWEHKDDGAEQRDYYAPEYWLTAIGKCGYKQIVVQSLQVIPGEEYARVCDVYVKDFMNNKYRVFTDDYMKSLDGKVEVGTSLLDSEEDVEIVAQTLANETDVKSVIDGGGIVAFMGHGNPVARYAHGNSRYWELEDALQKISTRFFVGTVDDEGTVKERDYAPNLCEDVLKRMESNGMDKTVKVQLYPLMSISGDHAHNDLSDMKDEGSWIRLFLSEGYDKAQASETNFTEPCYKSYVSGNPYIPALAERSAIRKIWMDHTREAITAVKAGEGISTPTTEPSEE